MLSESTTMWNFRGVNWREYNLNHLRLPPVFNEVVLLDHIVFCVVFCQSSFVVLIFFLWTLYCLFFFELRFLITFLEIVFISVYISNHTNAHVLSLCYLFWNYCLLLTFWPFDLSIIAQKQVISIYTLLTRYIFINIYIWWMILGGALPVSCLL